MLDEALQEDIMVISPAHAPPAEPESLGATLAAAGRTTPVWVLATLAVTGSAAIIAILMAARRHWVLALPFALMTAFGAWGAVEQGRAAVNQMQSLNATDRYLLNGILQAAGMLIILAGAAVATILIYAVTFYLAGAAPNL